MFWLSRIIVELHLTLSCCHLARSGCSEIESKAMQDVIAHLRAVLRSIAQFQAGRHLEESSGEDLGPTNTPQHARVDANVEAEGKLLRLDCWAEQCALLQAACRNHNCRQSVTDFFSKLLNWF